MVKHTQHKMHHFWESCGGLVVRIPSFCCQGPGSTPAWRTEILKAVCTCRKLLLLFLQFLSVQLSGANHIHAAVQPFVWRTSPQTDPLSPFPANPSAVGVLPSAFCLSELTTAGPLTDGLEQGLSLSDRPASLHVSSGFLWQQVSELPP